MLDRVNNRATQTSFLLSAAGFNTGIKMAAWRPLTDGWGNVVVKAGTNYKPLLVGLGKGLRFGGGVLGGLTTAYSFSQFVQDPSLKGGLDTGFGIVGFFGPAGLVISAGYYIYTSPFVQQGYKDFDATKAKKFAPGGDWEQLNSDFFYNGGLCFAEGTGIVIKDGSLKRIEDIIVGDTVLTYDFNENKIIKTIVIKTDSPLHADLVKITFSNASVNNNTQDHPYYVKGKGWCSYAPSLSTKRYGLNTSQLSIGDKCFFYNSGKLKKIKVKSITVQPGTVRTYNLTGLKEGSSYFANGILVNNEKATKNILYKQKERTGKNKK